MRLLRATLALAKIVGMLTDKLEKQEEKDGVKEHFDVFLKAISEAIKALEEAKSK